MARLFVRDNAQGWTIRELSADRYRFGPASSTPHRGGQAGRGRTSAPRALAVEPDGGGRPARKGALLLRRRNEGSPPSDSAADRDPSAWVVLPGPDAHLRINGDPIVLGIAALRHRDELSLDGRPPLYFSTERAVSVETYSAEDEPRCPRCTLSIERGQRFVCCPGCGVLHHQLPERECWTYAETCTLCDRSTDLSMGLHWSPEGL